MGDLRGEYLFDFAQICHIPPPKVDSLRYLDFIQLILFIDRFKKQLRQESNQ